LPSFAVFASLRETLIHFAQRRNDRKVSDTGNVLPAARVLDKTGMRDFNKVDA